MSKVVKGVKKVFKKIVKVIKKVAPIILAIGVVVFTAGAALGFAPAFATWSAAVSTATAGLGSGVLGTAVTGAITQAGYGAIIGGTVSAVSGGSFSEGAKSGAKVGAITGGVSGGFNAFKAGATLTKGAPPYRYGSTTPPAGSTPGTAPPISGPPAPPGTPVGGVGPPVGPGAPPGGGAGGLIRGAGKFIKDNPTLVGHAVQGIGAGLMAGSAADAERAFVRERFDQTRANYAGTDPGQTYRGLEPGTGKSPTERYDPRNFGSFEYRYDPEQGRIIKVPVGE